MENIRQGLKSRNDEKLLVMVDHLRVFSSERSGASFWRKITGAAVLNHSKWLYAYSLQLILSLGLLIDRLGFNLKSTKYFVCYTRRDGLITDSVRGIIKTKLNNRAIVYIHEKSSPGLS